LKLNNAGNAPCTFDIVRKRVQGNAVVEETQTEHVRANDTTLVRIDLREQHGWYDVSVTVADNRTFGRHLAGHVENGQDSWSDPALGV